MGSKISSFFQVVQPARPAAEVFDSSASGSSTSDVTWFKSSLQSSGQRTQRYKEYDGMDRDVEIARALDTIAEEMIGNLASENLPVRIELMDDGAASNNSAGVLTLKTALKYWCEVHQWRTRLFRICRNLVKYGDVFFKKDDPNHKWTFIHPSEVIGALVDPDRPSIVTEWVFGHLNQSGQNPVTASMQREDNVEGRGVLADEIVRFTLNDDMCETAPFGQSILQDVYTTFRQKQLLEDSVIIYRIRNAPERRVYYINTGKLPPPRAKAYLEQMKNELNQKRIPAMLSGGASHDVESIYNPLSMIEDIFISQGADGSGSKVDTLAGGQALGELSDLEYWQMKLWRGLRIPPSYMKSGDGQATYSDGKTGVAYILELRFCQFVQHLQSFVEAVLDAEFKKYLRQKNINVDPSTYKIRLHAPSNFGVYRQQELDSTLLQTYSSADNVPYLSKRFIMSRYLNLSDEDIALNDQMRREEMGLGKHGKGDMQKLYGKTEESAFQTSSGSEEEDFTPSTSSFPTSDGSYEPPSDIIDSLRSPPEESTSEEPEPTPEQPSDKTT